MDSYPTSAYRIRTSDTAIEARATEARTFLNSVIKEVNKVERLTFFAFHYFSITVRHTSIVIVTTNITFKYLFLTFILALIHQIQINFTSFYFY